VLDIAKILVKIIQDSTDFKCILTREKDEYLSLGERTEIANKESADVFISIHCNASENKVKHGCEVYFLSPAKTDWARAVAARENASMKYDDNAPTLDDVESILFDMAQTEFLEESMVLADYIGKEIVKLTNEVYRGVKQACFYVLVGAFMPAVLVEAEFISNPIYENKLRDYNYRKRIAFGIFRGLKKFSEYYSKRVKL